MRVGMELSSRYVQMKAWPKTVGKNDSFYVKK